MTNDNGSALPPVQPGAMGPQPGYSPYPPPPYGPGQFGPHSGYVPAAQYPASPGPPRKPRWPWIVAVLAAVAVVLVVLGGYVITRGNQPGNAARTVTVTYEVTGDPGAVEVRYNDSDGHLSSPQTVTLPWQTQISVREESRRLLLVRAERADSSKDPLMCHITSNNTTIDRQESAGRFVGCGGFLGGE